MKHSLCVLLCIILLCGCTNTVEHHPVNTVESENEIIQEETVVGKTMITPADDSWKYEVAERLYDEFCYFYGHRNDDMSNDKYYVDYEEPVQYHSYTNYNLMMATDRATGIAVYKDYLSPDKVEYVRSKCEEINSKIGSMEMLHFGYTESGLHYIAILFIGTTNSFYSRPLCDKIRNDTAECDFILDMSLKANYEVHDIFVEDLSNSNEYIDMNVDFFEYGITKETKIEKKYDLSINAEEILKRYNRKILGKGITDVKNNSWNLYVTQKHVWYEAKITSYGEETVLSNYIPVL